MDQTILALAEAAREIDDLWHGGKQSETANQMLCDALDAFWLAPRDADRAEVVRLRAENARLRAEIEGVERCAFWRQNDCPRHTDEEEG